MKLLASDYDGTLRYEPKVVKEDLDALKRWQQAGNLFVVVTGRSMESFMQELKENDFQCDFIVLNNGGVIYDGSGKCLGVRYLDFDKAMELIEYIRTLPCASYVLNDGYHRHRVVIDASQKDLKYGDMPQEKDEKEILEGGKIAQIVISLSDDELAASIVRYINEQFSGFIQAYACLLYTSRARTVLKMSMTIKWLSRSTCQQMGQRRQRFPILQCSWNLRALRSFRSIILI